MNLKVLFWEKKNFSSYSGKYDLLPLLSTVPNNVRISLTIGTSAMKTLQSSSNFGKDITIFWYGK